VAECPRWPRSRVASSSHRATSAYLNQRRAPLAQPPVQLETVASPASDSRRVYEVVPYVPYDGYSKLTGAAAYAATANVLARDKSRSTITPDHGADHRFDTYALPLT